MEGPHRDSVRNREDRLVERYRTVGLHVVWHQPTRSLLGTRPKPAPAEVIDLSVGGALLLAPHNPLLGPGAIADIELDGSRGRVEVRHVHAAVDPDQRYYGVLFLYLQPRLRARFFDAVASQRGDDSRLHQLWRSAH